MSSSATSGRAATTPAINSPASPSSEIGIVGTGAFRLLRVVLISLVVFDSAKPIWFRIDSKRSYQVVLYAPGTVGFVTTLLWRGTLKSYNRIIPYVRMADPAILLLYIKSNVFKLVQEESDSWWIHVSFGLAVAAICHYSSLAIATLALIQGSNILDNILDKFEEMDDTDSVNLEDEVKMWPQRPHLGYWKEDGSNRIVYGVRILPIDDIGPHPALPGMETPGRNQQLSTRPSEPVEVIELTTRASGSSSREDIEAQSSPSGNSSTQASSSKVPKQEVEPVPMIEAAAPDPQPASLEVTGTVSKPLSSMPPIVNMAGPLGREERRRLYHDKEKMGVLGATALRSALLDYADPDTITGIFSALRAGHFKVVFGTLLALVSAELYTFLGQLFYLLDYDVGADGHYRMEVWPRMFYAVHAILVAYCLGIWLLRPRGEQHLRAQVLLADRVYRFGRFRGTDGEEHVGISPAEVPDTWIPAAAADPVTPRAAAAVEVASRALKDGFYGDRDLAAGLQGGSGRATPAATKVVDDEGYVSLSRKAKEWWRRRKVNKTTRSEV
ncbi:hypothetical protein RB596_002030 [Gaeumannomyces avenae]